MCTWMCMGEAQQRLDSETGREIANLLAPVREDTEPSVATSVVSVISLGERQKPPSAVLESAVFQRLPAGERPHVPVEGAAQPTFSVKMSKHRLTEGTASHPDHVAIEVDKTILKAKSLTSEYTFLPENDARQADVEGASQSNARISVKSQNSQLSDSGSVSSIMDWARRTVDRKSLEKKDRKWGPISGPGRKPEAKCPSGALKPNNDSEETDSIDTISDAPVVLPSTKSTVKFRSNNTVVGPEGTQPRVVAANSNDTPPKAEEKPAFKSKLKKSMSRELHSPKTAGDSNELGLTAGSNMASKRWAKLSRQRSGIIKMSAGSNLASQAVREALSEIDDQISRCGDLYMDDEKVPSESLGPIPKLVKSKSFEHQRRLQRAPSNLSAVSRTSAHSGKSELPSVHEMHEVWAEPGHESPRSTKKARLSNSVSFMSAASNSVVGRQRYCCTFAWWMLRIVTVLFSVATLLAQVLMQESELADLIISICASFTTAAAILLAVLSGTLASFAMPNGLAASAPNGVHSSTVEDGAITDSFTPLTNSSAGWLEPSQTVLHQVRATLETAYSALATTEKEMTLWDQLREEQQSLLRSFNKIVTQDVSLHRGKANAFVVIVEECEALRKQLFDLCTDMKYKVQDFPSVDEATSTITDFAPSVASSNRSQQLGIMKNRPGASHRDWRNKEVMNACKAEQEDWARVVLLGASQLPEELPLPEALTDESVFLTLCGSAEELGECAERLLKKPGHSNRERWKVEGVNECMISPFTKEAIGAIVMEAIHVRFREEFLLLENIGQGTWGNVFRAKRLGDGKVLALKMVNAKRLQQKVRDAMDREVQLLRVVCWPTILFLLDAWVSEQMQCMLLPLCDGGDLLKETTTAAKGNTPISATRIFEWYAQTLHGLAYLHWRGVVHADIKPSNLLLALDRRSLIIGDFGSAMLLPGVGPHPARSNFVRRPNCTPVYASPESMLQEVHYASSDIWSVGASFFEIATFKCLLPAFLGDAKQLLAALNFEDVSSGGNLNRAKAALAALRDSNSVGDLKPELLEMFCRDPLKRPSAAGLAVRNKVSEQLQTLLVETGAVSIDEKVDHFKDFAKLLIESEEAADAKPPAESQSEDVAKVEVKDGSDRLAKPFLRRSATQPM